MFQVLRKGSTGSEVERWQNFLRGLSVDSSVIADSVFGNITEVETKAFQSSKGLTPDGVVGQKTLSIAIQLGYPVVTDESTNVDGPNWPPKPQLGSLNYADRERMFGKFSYVASPTYANPEAITMTGDWMKKNISSIIIPQLKGVVGVPSSCNVYFHSSLCDQASGLFKAWDDAGLKNLVKTWGGSWAPRFIRGSRTVLSNHAWATAFDINVQWNMLGVEPALKGKNGSVRELVEIAYNHGFYWGGWFSNRPDGMHFEAYKII